MHDSHFVGMRQGLSALRSNGRCPQQRRKTRTFWVLLLSLWHRQCERSLAEPGSPEVRAGSAEVLLSGPSRHLFTCTASGISSRSKLKGVLDSMAKDTWPHLQRHLSMSGDVKPQATPSDVSSLTTLVTCHSLYLPGGAAVCGKFSTDRWMR